MYRTEKLMPRKEYKTITVKTEAFLRFTRAIRKAQKIILYLITALSKITCF
jgi:hypothetical protein